MIRPVMTLVATLSLLAAEDAATLVNPYLQVTINPDERQVTIAKIGAASPFAKGALRGTVSKTDRRNNGVQVRYKEGGSDFFSLPNDSQFVLVRPTFAAGTTDVVLNRQEVIHLQMDLGPGELATLGTGSLVKPEKNPASYAWMALAHPKTKDGVVAAWLTHERATGVVACESTPSGPRLTGRSEYGRLAIPAGGEAVGETFMIGYFDDAGEGLSTWADAVAADLKIKLPPQPVVFCTWYANMGGAGSTEKTAVIADFAAKTLKPYGFTCVQIDDGWQLGDNKGNGPKKGFGGHNPKGPYPTGMAPTAQHIAKLGLSAGIWLMPFAGTFNDPYFADMQDLFVKNTKGEPYDTAWGGTSLDMTNPKAREYMSTMLTRITESWGYDYIKIDGLWTGLAAKQMYSTMGWREDGFGDAVFHDPKATNIDAFRLGLKTLRQAVGSKTFVLGCCTPQNMRSYAGAFGLVDAMRIGPDNAAAWKAWVGTTPRFGALHNHLNGRIWHNDPDPVYVRSDMSLEEARTMAGWHALTGHMLSIADWLPGLPAERLDLLRRIMPGHGLHARPLDLFVVQPTRAWMLTDNRPGRQRRDILGLFNWDDKPRIETIDLASVGLPTGDRFAIFDYWNNRPLPISGQQLTIEIPARGSRILSLRPQLDRPFLLSTSRHVAQGIIDVHEETWKGDTLVGRSDVVADDAYELRIAAPEYACAEVTVSPQDVAAGVSIQASSANNFVRVAIRSPQSRVVTWNVRFTKQVPPIQSPITPIANITHEISSNGDALTLRWTGQDGVDVKVSCDGADPVHSTRNAWTFLGLEAGSVHQFTLTPSAWDGRQGAAQTIAITVPATAPRPAAPPAPQLSLHDMTPVKASTARGQVMARMNGDGAPMSVNDTIRADGYGVVAPSELIYTVPENQRRFVAVAGLDDASKSSKVAVILKVVGEPVKGRLIDLAVSPVIRSEHQVRSWSFNVVVPKIYVRVKLVAEHVDGPLKTAQVDWIDAGFRE